MERSNKTAKDSNVENSKDMQKLKNLSVKNISNRSKNLKIYRFKDLTIDDL